MPQGRSCTPLQPTPLHPLSCPSLLFDWLRFLHSLLQWSGCMRPPRRRLARAAAARMGCCPASTRKTHWRCSGEHQNNDIGRFSLACCVKDRPKHVCQSRSQVVHCLNLFADTWMAGVRNWSSSSRRWRSSGGRAAAASLSGRIACWFCRHVCAALDAWVELGSSARPATDCLARCCARPLHFQVEMLTPAHCLCSAQVSEVCHTSLLDRRPSGRERWQPRVAHIR